VSGADAPLRDHRIADFLGRLASATPTPGGGGAAALTAAVAAGLTAMTVRLSASRIEDADRRAADLDRVRDELMQLADDDAAAYAVVLAAMRRSAGAGDADRSQRRADALQAASEIPLAVANRAADIAEVAARLARTGNPALRGDARTAVHLAHAAATSAAELVAINVRQGQLDPTVAAAARTAVERAARAVADGSAAAVPEASS
jgi:methenyltetrahydrofolate cyclohydrolase